MIIKIKHEMKKFLKYTTFLLVIMTLTQCDDPREFEGSSQPYVYITNENLSGASTEGCDPVSFTVAIPFVNTSGTVMIATEGSAIFGTDYNIEGDVSNVTETGFTLNLTDNEESVNGSTTGVFQVIFPDDEIIDGAKNISISLQTASATGLGNIKIGTWAGVGKSAEITIGDASAINYSGTYNVSSNATGGDCSGDDFTGTITLELISGSTYTIDDITYGLYDYCYGSGSNPGEIEILNGSVFYLDVPDVVYGGDDFDGTGVADPCNGTLIIEWSNNYGDSATSTAVKS